jgi:hypothetical protein
MRYTLALSTMGVVVSATTLDLAADARGGGPLRGIHGVSP